MTYNVPQEIVMDPLAMLGIFVGYPWLALVPGVFFLGLNRFVRSRIITFAGITWLLYGCYELLMYKRILCSGECNIRIDLILIYPVLISASVAAIFRWVRVRSDLGKSQTSSRTDTH